ncbi:MAG: hypothetical protein KAJ28_09885 [Flavobacteriaceae bacterium]|nr:hypothetical protein [Flavobacteriaceae bacterium]
MTRSTKVLYWSPRIVCILAILFVSLFAFDAFTPELTFWQQIGAFIMHLIPSFILLILLIISWKWEFIGGIIFTVIGFGLSPLVFIHNYNMNHSVWMSLGIISLITIPFAIVGILFILSHFRRKKERLLESKQSNP